MESLEITAKTVDEAVEIALKELGAKRDEVEIAVLSRGRSGILGIGAEPARVRVSLVSPRSDFSAQAKETLEQLFKHMGISAAITARERTEQPETPGTNLVALNITGEDSGLLIGRRGETLSALQFMVNFMLSRKLKGRVSVNLDVEDYKERRTSSLQKLALAMAEKVVNTGHSVTLEPMAASERRIIHVTLAGHPRVSTQSVGDGESRKVAIFPKRGVQQAVPGSQARPQSEPAPDAR